MQFYNRILIFKLIGEAVLEIQLFIKIQKLMMSLLDRKKNHVRLTYLNISKSLSTTLLSLFPSHRGSNSVEPETLGVHSKCHTH